MKIFDVDWFHFIRTKTVTKLRYAGIRLFGKGSTAKRAKATKNEQWVVGYGNPRTSEHNH